MKVPHKEEYNLLLRILVCFLFTATLFEIKGVEFRSDDGSVGVFLYINNTARKPVIL